MSLAKEKEAGSGSGQGRKHASTWQAHWTKREGVLSIFETPDLPSLFVLPQMAKSLGLGQEARFKCQFTCDA